MTTEELSKIQPLTLTRGAAYLLEGILQDPRPCDTPIKIAKWSRLYGAVRKANDRTIEVGGVKYDHEKARNKIILSFGDTTNDPSEKRKLESALLEFDEACEAWRQQEIPVLLSKKHIDTAKAAVEYRAKNQDVTKGIAYPINEHGLRLITELCLDDAE